MSGTSFYLCLVISTFDSGT